MVTIMTGQRQLETMTLPELAAIKKLAEREIEVRKGKETVHAGTYALDFDVHVTGSVVREDDTHVSPKFNLNDHMRTVLLRYAATLDDPIAWLTALVGPNSALTATIKLGAKASEGIPAAAAEYLAACEKDAKVLFQAVSAKVPQAGRSFVTGSMAKLGKAVK